MLLLVVGLIFSLYYEVYTCEHKLKKPFNRSWPSHQSASLPPLTVEDVEHFFEEERKTFSNLKSSTVGAYFRRIVSTSKHSSQTNFFQQLGKRMKESFGSFAKSSDILEQQQKQPNHLRAQVTFSF